MKFFVFSLMLVLSFCLCAETLINLNFENSFENWTVVDNDEDGKQWERSDDADAVHNGAWGAQIEYNREQNDDWLLSPQLSIPYNRTLELKLWAKSSSNNLPESFKVKISTASSDIADFTDYIAGVSAVPNVWTEYVYDLTDYQGNVFYIGIQCDSEDQAFLYIDDITLTMEDGPGVDGWLLSNNYDIGMDFNSIYFPTETIGYACGLAGTTTSAYKSTDGGAHWTGLDVNTTNSTNRYLRDVYFKTDLTGFFFGGLGGDAVIIKTEDGGTTWNEVTNNAEGYVNSVDFLDDNHGIACLNTGKILETTDGGSTWTQRDIGNLVHLNVVQFVDNLVGYMGGRLSTVLKTTDGGQNWTNLDIGADNYDIHDLHFITSDYGYVITGTSLYFTDDGGVTWNERVVTGNTQDLRAIEFADASNGWLAGNNGTIYKTGNGGLTWYSQPSGTLSNLLDIYCYDFEKDWIAGAEGIVLYSVTGGGVDNDENTVERVTDMEASNYPNPFNPRTTISFSIKDANIANVAIYNIKGQKVFSFDNVKMNTNSGQVVWNGIDRSGKVVGTGVYFYKITTDNQAILTKKMVLIK